MAVKKTNIILAQYNYHFPDYQKYGNILALYWLDDNPSFPTPFAQVLPLVLGTMPEGIRQTGTESKKSNIDDQGIRN